MKFEVLSASMTYSKEEGYVGQVQFKVEGHREQYEITLHRKRGKDWSYGLHFFDASGPEEEIFAVEEELEQNDALFEQMIDAAEAALKSDENSTI